MVEHGARDGKEVEKGAGENAGMTCVGEIKETFDYGDDFDVDGVRALGSGEVGAGDDMMLIEIVDESSERISGPEKSLRVNLWKRMSTGEQRTGYEEMRGGGKETKMVLTLGLNTMEHARRGTDTVGWLTRLTKPKRTWR